MASEEGSSQSVRLTAAALVVVLLAAALALVLGWFGLSEQVHALNTLPTVEFGTRPWDIVYYDFQLFVLDSDPVGVSSTLPWTLQIARFLAPATTVYAVFLTFKAVLARQIEQVSARLTPRRTVIIGDGPAVTELVRQVLEDKGRVVLVLSEAPTAPLPNRRVYRVTGDPRDIPVLRRAGTSSAREVFAVARDSAINAEVAVSVLTLMNSARRSGNALRCHVDIDDSVLLSALIDHKKHLNIAERVELWLFNRHDLAARRIVASAPPPDVPHPDVVVVGQTPLAEALLIELARWRTVARLKHADGSRATPVDVQLLLPDPDAHKPEPSCDPSSIRLTAGPLERGVDVTALSGATAPHVYVCLDRDADGLKAGHRLLHASRAADRPEPDVVVAVARWAGSTGPGRIRNDGPASVLSFSGLTTINVIKGVYDIRELRDEMTERLARAIHAEYLDLARQRGDTLETNKSLRPWAELPEHLQDSNRAQAQDIEVKLGLIDCEMTPITGDAEPFAFTDAEIKRLAQHEHKRWMDRLLGMGWKWGPRRDAAAKLHPDLVDWTSLSEDSRDADRNAVRTIPWLLASIGYRVLRVTPIREHSAVAAE
ncbi:RyR domain-containing protein [Cryptosporangium sp. NPDC051539]|uniref:RyR domain-containing protein n=1 Tax=Cryptosporangium sp. NPDC051539 TaxID=3363962 RepID=UPI00378AD180